jgi:uncharacterized membrane protein YcfT
LSDAAIGSPDQPKTSARMPWMDGVRGVAIGLLLIWHACAVPRSLGMSVPHTLIALNDFFRPFRMQTLMMLSGLLLARSLDKSLPRYYAGKFAMIAWPYVIWVLVARVVWLGDIWPWWYWRSWAAVSYLWFLFFLGCYYLVAPVLTKLLPAWASVLVCLVIGAALPQGMMGHRLAYFGVFFFTGHLLAHNASVFNLMLRRGPVALWAAGAAALGLASMLWPTQLLFNIWTVPISLAGTMAMASVCSRRTWTGTRPAETLTFLGFNSIVYYVAHLPVMLVLSGALLHSVNAWVLSGVNLVVAVAVCTLLALGRRRAPVRWLFTAPDRVTRGVQSLLSAVGRGWARVATRAMARPPSR